jgi:hypothetical protein
MTTNTTAHLRGEEGWFEFGHNGFFVHEPVSRLVFAE